MEDARLRKVEFGVFTQRMLLRRLDETSIWELHAEIIREAERSASLARATSYPFLVFPCLFDERSRVAADRFREETDRYWQLVTV